MEVLKRYRKLTDEQLINKIKRAEHWVVLELISDLAVAILLILTIVISFENENLLHCCILIIMIPAIALVFFPLIIRFAGKRAEIQLKENKFKKVKDSNIKDYIILEDKKVSQEIFNQCVECVRIERVPSSQTRAICFYLINEEIVSKVVDTNDELWKTISLK